MRRVIRTRKVQPDYSIGMVVAAIVLIVIISLGWLTWWTLILVLLVPPIVNSILTGRTTKEETAIEEDP